MSRSQRSWWSVFTVEQGFKQRQLLRLLGLSSVYVLVSTGVLIAFYLQVIAPVANSQLALRPEAAPSVARLALAWAALMTGLSGVFAVVTGLYVSHLTAGPIHCFKQELARIEAGERPQPIRVRRGYELVDVAESLNRALEALWQRATPPADRRP